MFSGGFRSAWRPVVVSSMLCFPATAFAVPTSVEHTPQGAVFGERGGRS